MPDIEIVATEDGDISSDENSLQTGTDGAGSDPEEVKEAAENVNRKEKFAGFLFGGGLFESSIRISSSIITTGAPNKMYSFLPVSGNRSLSPCSKKFQTSYMNAA